MGQNGWVGLGWSIRPTVSEPATKPELEQVDLLVHPCHIEVILLTDDREVTAKPGHRVEEHSKLVHRIGSINHGPGAIE